MQQQKQQYPLQAQQRQPWRNEKLQPQPWEQQGEQLRRAVAAIEEMAASLVEGRTIKDVTLDPGAASCAETLAAALPRVGGRRGQTREEPAQVPVPVTEALVRAASAYSRLRVLHAPLLTTLGELRICAWREMPAACFADAMVAYAWLLPGAMDLGLLRRWAVALNEVSCSLLAPQDLANVAWAAGALQMGCLHGLAARLAAAAGSVDLGRLSWPQLTKLAWGLAKMTPEGLGNAKRPCWASNVIAACKSRRVAAGHGLGELLWALVRLGQGATARSLFERAPAQALGRDAYVALLRAAECGSSFETAVFRHLAATCSSKGLRAAVLNAAALRCCRAGFVEEARAILAEMAGQSLWTPVTYRLAGRIAAASGDPSLELEGSPAYPGLVDAGDSAHKYVRALYYALRNSQPGDAASGLAALEAFSRTKGWLKFGASDEKGAVVDEVVERLQGRSEAPLVVEFGTFLGYSAVRMAQQLSSGARIVTFENDPEVACLALNFIEFAGIEADIDVWIGHCEDLTPQLSQRFGPRAVSMVYMDHNQMIYHEDVARLEASGVLEEGAFLVATQVLKPGAPLLLWRLAHAERSGRCSAPLELVSAPDCGCPMMEDWVAVAQLRACTREVDGSKQWDPPEPPAELQLLAAECNLMRWRTTHGLVDEQRWNGFVQHVRSNTERLVGVVSTRQAWPDARAFQRARRLQYSRLDF